MQEVLSFEVAKSVGDTVVSHGEKPSSGLSEPTEISKTTDGANHVQTVAMRIDNVAWVNGDLVSSSTKLTESF